MRKYLVNSVLNNKQNSLPFFITGDLGYSVLEPLQEYLGENFINVGILEQSMMSMAGGIAKNGNKVFVYSITNFATFRALEQIRLDISYQKLSVCIVGVGTGFQYQSAGYSHWGVEDLGIISMLENVRIFCPSDQSDVDYAVTTFLSDGKPTYIRLGKAISGNEVDQSKLKKIKNFSELGSGNDLIFCHGSISQKLLNHDLFNENVHKIIIINEVSDLESIYNQIVNSQTQKISVLEEVVFPGGLGSRISRIISTSGANIPFRWIGVDSFNLPSFGGDEDYLRSYFFGENYLERLFYFS
jgi:transketolase